jgi:hypothetical protein
LGVIFCFCLTASAQVAEHGDLSFGYSYIRANSFTSFNLNGFSTSGSWIIKGVGIVGDLGAYHVGSIGGKSVSADLVTFLGGVRFTLHRTTRTKFFVHGLVGGAHANAASFQQPGILTKTVLAGAAGGGVDWFLTPSFGFRAQGDYLPTRFPEKAGTTNTQNNIRITAGIVLRF